MPSTSEGEHTADVAYVELEAGLQAAEAEGHRLAVERDDDVARLQARLGGRTVRGDRVLAVRQAVADLDALTFVLLVEVDPDDRVHGLALGDQLLDCLLDLRRGDGEADPDAPSLAGGPGSRCGGDRRVHADDLAGHVEQGATGVAGVDRRIGLDGIDEGGVRGDRARCARKLAG